MRLGSVILMMLARVEGAARLAQCWPRFRLDAEDQRGERTLALLPHGGRAFRPPSASGPELNGFFIGTRIVKPLANLSLSSSISSLSSIGQHRISSSRMDSLPIGVGEPVWTGMRQTRFPSIHCFTSISVVISMGQGGAANAGRTRIAELNLLAFTGGRIGTSGAGDAVHAGRTREAEVDAPSLADRSQRWMSRSALNQDGISSASVALAAAFARIRTSLTWTSWIWLNQDRISPPSIWFSSISA